VEGEWPLSRLLGERSSTAPRYDRRRYSDGALAYFGYPYAQEDDAEQQRAALALVDAVANIRTDPVAALQARIGIATALSL
jgi:class 3 adenylate cyclase